MATPAVARAHHHNRKQRNGAPRQRSADGQVFGVLLMVFGLGWLLRVAGVIELEWESLLAAVLVVLGVGMAVTARARGGLLMVLGILLSITLATTSSVGDIGYFGEVDIRPVSIAEVENNYRFFGGSFELDLSAVEFPKGETPVDVWMGGGELLVVVPYGVPVNIDAKLGGGDIRLLGDERAEGPSPRASYTDPDYEGARRRLNLDIEGGGGEIEVRRAPAPVAASEPTGADDAAR